MPPASPWSSPACATSGIEAGLFAAHSKYTRAFAQARPDGQIVQQLGTQIPWHHNARLTQFE